MELTYRQKLLIVTDEISSNSKGREGYDSTYDLYGRLILYHWTSNGVSSLDRKRSNDAIIVDDKIISGDFDEVNDLEIKVRTTFES
jgi:hypothetical protein